MILAPAILSFILKMVIPLASADEIFSDSFTAFILKTCLLKSLVVLWLRTHGLLASSGVATSPLVRVAADSCLRFDLSRKGSTSCGRTATVKPCSFRSPPRHVRRQDRKITMVRVRMIVKRALHRW